jgi:hypothetical protein
MNCEFCKKEFVCKGTLITHQKTAKYCLQLQGKNIIQPFECNFCVKNFTTQQNLKEHILVCKEKEKIDLQQKEKKYEVQIINIKVEYEAKIENQKQEYIEKLNNKDSYYQEKLTEKNEYISKLEAKLEKMESKLEKMEARLETKLEKLESTVTTIALEAKTVSAKPVTTNNTTNHITVTSNTNVLNLSKEHVNKVLKDNMDYNVVYAGQAGLATFVVEKMLRDSDGKLMYYCVDSSRQMFEFTGENGEKIRDLKAEKLIQSLLKGDVIRTGLEEAAKGWNTEDQQLNLERTTVFGPKVSEYADLNRNNTVFRSKVSSLTT